MEDVLIFGASGLGGLVCDLLQQAGRYRPVAFLDSNPRLRDRYVDGLPVLGGMEMLSTLQARGVRYAVVAIGDNLARVEVAHALERRGMHLVGAIHPSASISPSARIAEHVILGARVMVCVNAVIGAHCVLAAGVIVEHDNVIHEGVFLHPAVRLAGGVEVQVGATLGIGTCVVPNRRIGQHAFVEPGSVVVQDVPAGGVVCGVPAHRGAVSGSRFIPQKRALSTCSVV